jgi:hypothetical protein
MARGKHLSLEEARKQRKLKQFAKEHPAEGDEELFDSLLNAMAKGGEDAGHSKGGPSRLLKNPMVGTAWT